MFAISCDLPRLAFLACWRYLSSTQGLPVTSWAADVVPEAYLHSRPGATPGRDNDSKSRATALSENSQNRDLQRYKLLKGAYSRVARRLDVDRSFVSRVAHGERRSSRVEQALAAEMRRIEKRLAGKDHSDSESSVELATPASREIVKNSVLVVDDEPNVANTVAQILREHGFESRVAYGGQEAIREVAAQAPDIIISDVVMPHIN